MVSEHPQSSELTRREPGEAVIDELLRRQAELPPQSRVATIFGKSPIGPDSESWYAGAVGEREVGRALDALGSAWTVLHSVPVGNTAADIDHLVIGPGGVVTINTKHHADKPVWVDASTFLVGGARQPYLRNSEHEARRVTTALAPALRPGFEVTAVIAVLGAAMITIRTPPGSVVVVDATHLVRWLRSQRGVLSSAEIQDIAARASREETWQVSERSGDGGPVQRESTRIDGRAAAFGELQKQVARARRRRLGWALGGTALALSALISVEPALIGYVSAGISLGR